MRQGRKSTVVAIIGLGALALLATPSLAANDQSATKAGVPVQFVHMGQAQAGQLSGQPCSMGMMGSGMMGPGMMAPGMGMMLPQGMMGPGMMGPGSGGQGMMAPGQDGQGMMGPGFGRGPGLGDQIVPVKDLTSDDVRHFLQHRLEMQGNERLKVGEVNEADDDTIIADITTVDGSLVQRFEVDRHTGQMRDTE